MLVGRLMPNVYRRTLCNKSVLRTFYTNGFQYECGLKLKHQAYFFQCIQLQKRIANARMFQSAQTLNNNKIKITFIDRHGKKHDAVGTVGDSLLDIVIDNDLCFETYGVCEGTVSCSTCHVILDQNTFEKLEEPLMDEMDMLDLACGLTETSRLGCQVNVTKDMDGITVTLPKEITDARDV